MRKTRRHVGLPPVGENVDASVRPAHRHGPVTIHPPGFTSGHRPIHPIFSIDYLPLPVDWLPGPGGVDGVLVIESLEAAGAAVLSDAGAVMPGVVEGVAGVAGVALGLPLVSAGAIAPAEPALFALADALEGLTDEGKVGAGGGAVLAAGEGSTVRRSQPENNAASMPVATTSLSALPEKCFDVFIGKILSPKRSGLQSSAS